MTTAQSRWRECLRETLEVPRFPPGCRVDRGKVRDCCVVGDYRIVVTSDRISAFDRVLGTIPFKGQVLNQLAAYGFEKTRHIVPNHVVDVPDPNIMVVRECRQLPLEFVVRGYLTGVTKTSLWEAYRSGLRRVGDVVLPDGMRKNQRLDQPVVTPTTKLEDHDRNITRAEAVSGGLVDADTFDEAMAMCLKLFAAGSRLAADHGLILVDTKYELGRMAGRLVVSDEIHTPDSSRYWLADEYEKRFAEGVEQHGFDKEMVRIWLAQQGFSGDGPIPVLPDEIRIAVAERYLDVYERLTGAPLQMPATGESVAGRVSRVLSELVGRMPGDRAPVSSEGNLSGKELPCSGAGREP